MSLSHVALPALCVCFRGGDKAGASPGRSIQHLGQSPALWGLENHGKERGKDWVRERVVPTPGWSPRWRPTCHSSSYRRGTDGDSETQKGGVPEVLGWVGPGSGWGGGGTKKVLCERTSQPEARGQDLGLQVKPEGCPKAGWDPRCQHGHRSRGQAGSATLLRGRHQVQGQSPAPRPP